MIVGRRLTVFWCIGCQGLDDGAELWWAWGWLGGIPDGLEKTEDADHQSQRISNSALEVIPFRPTRLPFVLSLQNHLHALGRQARRPALLCTQVLSHV